VAGSKAARRVVGEASCCDPLESDLKHEWATAAHVAVAAFVIDQKNQQSRGPRVMLAVR
jgi:hypothetical protein